MMAAMAYQLVSTVDRILGGEPLEPELAKLEESRPVDFDDCTLCGGTGVYAVAAIDVAPRHAYVTCPSCAGSGERSAA